MVNFYAQHRRKAFREVGGGGGEFEPETDTLIAALTGSYDAPRQIEINTLIKSLKDNGIWATRSVLTVAGLNSTDSLINWKNPGTFNGTAVDSPTFTADRGFTGNGTTSYINTNFNPNTAGSPFTQNSNSFGAYCRLNVGVLADNILGINNSVGSQFFLRPRGAGDVLFARANQSPGSDTVANTDSRGDFLVTRVSSSSVITYRNGSQIQSRTATSLALSDFNLNFFALAFNNNGTASTFSTNQVASYNLGGVLNATEAANFNTALTTYLTYIGAAV